MSLCDDYTGSNDRGSAGGADKKPAKKNRWRDVSPYSTQICQLRSLQQRMKTCIPITGGLQVHLANNNTETTAVCLWWCHKSNCLTAFAKQLFSKTTNNDTASESYELAIVRIP